MEANTKLFPAVFVKPTTSSMFQFELGSMKVSLNLQSFLIVSTVVSCCDLFLFLFSQNVTPLSGLLRSQSTNTSPQCPPRVQVQQLSPVTWTRVPDQALLVLVERPDEHCGWAVECSEPRQVLNLHIPDENR